MSTPPHTLSLAKSAVPECNKEIDKLKVSEETDLTPAHTHTHTQTCENSDITLSCNYIIIFGLCATLCG